MKTLQDLMDTLPQIGKLEWIGLRSARREFVQSVKEAKVIAGLGLEGDHRSFNKKPDPNSKRQVTLIQAEHLVAVASMLGKHAIDPSLTRRNLVISGINLLAFKDKNFSIGEVILEYTGLCHPCSRMEENLGPGGYNAMRGHGGITARILHEAVTRVGDEVRVAIRS
jgi:MOSC domain-containing protein YiiM